MSLNYKLFFPLLLLIINTLTIEAQIIVRLWEAEASATANTIVLALIKNAEVKVNKEMGKLNTELRKKIPYYGLMDVFSPIFQINNTITRIQSKLSKLVKINTKVPLLFNRKKKRKERKWKMYGDYLISLQKDVGHEFSNNGNLLKTSLEIISNLEEVEKDIDDTLENLTVSENIANLF